MLQLINKKAFPFFGDIIYSQLSRCSTARGSSYGFSLVSSTKIEAPKSCLFKLSGLVKSVTKVATGCLRMIEVAKFVL